MIPNKGQESSSTTLCTFPPENPLLYSLSPWATPPHKNMLLVGSPQTRGSFMASSPALPRHPPQVLWISAPLQFSMSTETVCFTLVFSTGLWGNLLWCLDHLLPHLLHHYWCLWVCFLHIVFFIPLSSSAGIFMLYIKYCLGPAITLSACVGV